MRLLAFACAIAVLVPGAALGQQPAPGHRHDRGQPADTTMRGMPGMKPAPPDTSRHRSGTRRSGASRADTTRHGMHHPGMAPAHAMPGMPGMGGGGHAMPMPMPGPLGLPESRDGSGTAWQPDASPMYAVHGNAGRWALMFHGDAFLQSIHEGGDRGEQQLGSVNWFMGMARRPLGRAGDLTLRGMVSLEPLTVGKCGYPDLLATGEQCNGRALHDRQHPHDVFMELAARYRRELSRDVGLELYGGPAGEPALGPVAFPHRASAMWSPLAPIGHHWQDATHIAFGVLTGGVYGRRWKLEGSAFNGREPDDGRFDIDPAALDSWSGRVWLLPTERLAVQLSTGFLAEAERTPEGGRVDVHRTTASLTYEAPFRGGGSWASTLVWGRNRAHGLSTGSVLVESALELDDNNVVHGRGEVVGKTGEDLALNAPGLDDDVFHVGKLTLGYARRLPLGGTRSLRTDLGAELSVARVPGALRPFYGSTSPLGFALYASVRPARMRMATAALAPAAASTPPSGRTPP